MQPVRFVARGLGTIADVKPDEWLGLDPMAVRRANVLAAPTFTGNDLMVNSYGLPDCIDWVERASGWKSRKGTLPRGKGLGFACSHYVSGASKSVNPGNDPNAVVKIRLDLDGSINVLCGAAEIGQGSTTVLSQTVAEVLGIDLSRIRFVTGTAISRRRTTAPIRRASPSRSATQRSMPRRN